MEINRNIFRAYDIRGIALKNEKYPVDLDEEVAYLIGKATGTYLKGKFSAKNIAVGRDCRISGPSLQKAYIKGLLETGLDVTDIGLATSPFVYWTVCSKNFDAGTNISASHNPKEYNGFKIVSKNAHSICGDELQEIYKIIVDNKFIQAEKGTLTEANYDDEYVGELTTKVKLNRPLKVVIDAGNGTAGIMAEKLLKGIGCDLTSLYCEPDGNFPNHIANPEDIENMHDLINKVKEIKADIGIGFDGDGDRVGIVDENGRLYSSDLILLILARDLMKRMPGSKIVFEVKTSQIIINELKKIGAEPIMWKTGHSFIEQKIKEVGAPLAGEVSGHLYFGENYYGFDDALMAAIKISEITANTNIPFSEHFKDIPESIISPELKVPCSDDKKFDVVKKITEHFTSLYDCITIDGVRIKFDEISWAAIRASNTSPNLTLRFEAKSQEQMDEIQKIVYDALNPML